MRYSLYFYLIAACSLFLVSCVSTPKPPEVPIVIANATLDDLQDRAVELQHRRQLRVTEVWHRLTSANASFCGGSVKGSLGIGLGYSALYDKPFQKSYQRLFGVGAVPQIIYLQPDGPADKAGLKKGDLIVGVEASLLASQSDENIDSWVKDILLPALNKKKQVTLTVKNQQGVRSEIIVYPEPTCRQPISLYTVNTISAAEVDNLRVYITTGMLRFLQNDDQLAWILGHELAHITLHSQGSTKTSEHLADYVGSYFTARAGYDPDKIIDFWQRWAAEDPPTIALEGYKTHPSIAIRIAKIRAANKEITEKMIQNKDLTPNLHKDSGLL
ncbi:MAG: M48 family metalloprotease [Magnetococcales bacterium]|nr:M48 family metalloprotease [Magnetococcales bacterium]